MAEYTAVEQEQRLLNEKDSVELYDITNHQKHRPTRLRRWVRSPPPWIAYVFIVYAITTTPLLAWIWLCLQKLQNIPYCKFRCDLSSFCFRTGLMIASTCKCSHRLWDPEGPHRYCDHFLAWTFRGAQQSMGGSSCAQVSLSKPYRLHTDCPSDAHVGDKTWAGRVQRPTRRSSSAGKDCSRGCRSRAVDERRLPRNFGRIPWIALPGKYLLPCRKLAWCTSW